MENLKVNKALLKDAINQSNSLITEILLAQEQLRKECDPKTCNESFAKNRFGMHHYVCSVCDRK